MKEVNEDDVSHGSEFQLPFPEKVEAKIEAAVHTEKGMV